MNEQELFALMAIAQEQQKAVDAALSKLAVRQIELDALIVRANKAAVGIEQASQSAASTIQKTTQSAVEQGIKAALERVSEQTRSTLGQAINPATNALKEVTELVIDTDKRLHHTKNSLSWKFSGIMTMVLCMLFATTMVLAKLFVPSPGEIADLRATVADLERRGGKVQLTTCGNSNRLCAKINVGANKSKGGYGQGESDTWMILQGY